MKNTLLIALLALTASFNVLAHDLSVAARVEAAMHGEHRSEQNQARNRYRHPVGTLEFLGLEDGMSVIEITPGGGWYSEILAPVMRDHGQYIAASYDMDVEGQPEYRYPQHERLLKKFAERPKVYDQVKIATYSPPQSTKLAAPGSADMVLTFRNSHGWVRDDLAADIYADFFKVLKPGGILGVVQHRAPENQEPKQWARKGYVSEATIINIAEKAGFVLAGKSEVNANSADHKDYDQGVWTLPPSFRLGEQDQEEYRAIGESDRMTLKFQKPAR